MKETKLIIISGVSGTGKSTTAKNLSIQLNLNRIPFVYLHEECVKHPIRNREFSLAPITTIAGMQKNIEDIFKRWEKLVKRILAENKLYLLEACLYENITRYFFECNLPSERIFAFYDDLMKILNPLNPVIIHLITTDIKKTFEAVYPQRGNWWKKLILSDTSNKYFLEKCYSGDEGIYQMLNDYQNYACLAFDRFNGSKLRIDTLSGDWTGYYHQIADFLDISWFRTERQTIENPLAYCGRYECRVKGKLSGLVIEYDGNNMYCKSFWPYMKLDYEGNNKFTFSSFPIDLTFFHDGLGFDRVHVKSNYDWGLTDNILVRVPD